MDWFDRILLIIAFVCIYALVGINHSRISDLEGAAKPKQPTTLVDVLHRQEAKLAAWAKANNVVFPDVWAAACMETTDPELCIAMVKQESHGRTDLKVGPAGEVGPFQILPRHWEWLVGFPSREPKKAARQWDLIMIDLQEKRSLPAAIGAYNGNGKSYVFNVWTAYREVSR